MKRIIRLTESDLTRIVKRVLKEDVESEDITQLKKEDIKSIRFLDGKGRDILESFEVAPGSNDIVVKVKPVNFVSPNEKTQLRILLDQRIKVDLMKQREGVKVVEKTDGTLIYMDNALKLLQDNFGEHEINYSIRTFNLIARVLGVTVKFNRDSSIDYGF
jgi:hypothetical protein